MPSVVDPNAQAGPQDDEYDDVVNEFLQGLPEPGNNAVHETAQPAADVDQEIQVRKKRRPVQKLDSDLLLSSRGIPRLQRISKQRLRFKGKGHEFKDIELLLNTYQLWLDDMFPKAKFKDALAMVEKEGRKSRMQVARRAWIDSSKPSRAQGRDEERIEDFEISGGLVQESAGNAIFDDNGNVVEDQENSLRAADGDANAPQEDELDALLAENDWSAPRQLAQQSRPSQSKRGPFDEDQPDEDQPDEDELDALLAEDADSHPPVVQPAVGTGQSGGPFAEEPDEDDLDAHLAGTKADAFQEGQQGAADGANRPEPSKDSFADEEEVMASMGVDW